MRPSADINSRIISDYSLEIAFKIGKMGSSAGANRKKGLSLLLIVIHCNNVKGKHAADPLGTCFQMLTIPVECPLPDIASRFTVSVSNRNTLSWI